MLRRGLIASVASLTVMLLLAATAMAGGWATVEIDQPLGEVRADTQTTIGFTMKQHGQTPITWPATYFSAMNVETGETVRFDARPEGDLGHWVVDVVFPSEGVWNWEIAAEDLDLQGTFTPVKVLPAMLGVGRSDAPTHDHVVTLVSESQAKLESRFDKQLSSLESQVAGLESEVKTLSAERDALQKQISNLETGQEANEDTGDGVPWWAAAIVGATAAALAIVAAVLLAIRGGWIERPVPGPATG